MLTKPYDEVFLDRMDMPHNITDGHHFAEWLKYHYKANEVEAFVAQYNRGYTIRYKRYELQYG